MSGTAAVAATAATAATAIVLTMSASRPLSTSHSYTIIVVITMTIPAMTRSKNLAEKGDFPIFHTGVAEVFFACRQSHFCEFSKKDRSTGQVEGTRSFTGTIPVYPPTQVTQEFHCLIRYYISRSSQFLFHDVYRVLQLLYLPSHDLVFEIDNIVSTTVSTLYSLGNLRFACIQPAHEGQKKRTMVPEMPIIADSTWGVTLLYLFLNYLRNLRQVCVDMPTYTVPAPRPQKPPLSIKPIYCKGNHHRVDLSASSNLPNSNSTSRTISIYMANPRTTAIQNHRHLATAMSLNLDPPGSSRWFDEFINQQPHDLQASTSSLTQESSGSFLQLTTPHEIHHSTPNLKSQPNRKRASASIAGHDEVEGNHRTKIQKRDGTPRSKSKTDSLSVNASSSYTHNVPPSLGPPTAVSNLKLFACPFFKEAEKTILNTEDWKCCMGPGWKIHRLKEHLYRKHSSGLYQCSRCLTEFKDSLKLHQHQRSTTPCLIQTNGRVGIGRIDGTQLTQLKKKSRQLSDEDKWRDIYRIIFRLDPTADLPSPYYENITSAPKNESSSHHGADSLSQFQLYLQYLLQNCKESQQNISIIQACLGLIGWYHDITGCLSLPVSGAPSLVFDSNAFSTTPESQPRVSGVISTDENDVKAAHEFSDMDMEAFEGFSMGDDSFEADLNRVFLPASEPPWNFYQPHGTSADANN
ncbi:hypothetical protein HD806DRAFT_532870 [Xylariaceae sp. AK1471]|nr:hypothetical protein HD806DRAFT_532870 [Xylariaceae sp. AK1471]